MDYIILADLPVHIILMISSNKSIYASTNLPTSANSRAEIAHCVHKTLDLKLIIMKDLTNALVFLILCSKAVISLTMLLGVVGVGACRSIEFSDGLYSHASSPSSYLTTLM